MDVKVKICGLTNRADAYEAAAAGADALGFIFHDRSPRAVSIPEVRAIIRSLPDTPWKVGVFVNASAEDVRRAIEETGLTAVQFHGDESPEFCAQFKVLTFKAFRVRDSSFLERIPLYATDYALLDAYSPAQPGGTGQRFDWDLAVPAVALERPIFLAGGLTPDNVAEAVRRVRPAGVDVSSGVEASPGRKDLARVRAFIQAARAAAETVAAA